MAKEVSGFHLQVSLDIGDFLGVPRSDLLSFFPTDLPVGKKWTRVDWAPFAAMTRYCCANVGRLEELIPIGQQYTYERIGTRFTHWMTQFGGGWDRVVWASKHFFNPRLIRGYESHYEKLGHNHFRIRSKIPEHLDGCEEYFWLFAGVWTGGNRISKLKHQILSLEVHPHGSCGEILFAERSRKSRMAFNPIRSRLKAMRDLRTAREELDANRKLVFQEARNLDLAFHAVLDAVFVIQGNQVIQANHEARLLQSCADFDVSYLLNSTPSSTSVPTLLGGKWIRISSRIPLPSAPTSCFLVTLEDVTRMVELEQDEKQYQQRTRELAEAQIEDSLGIALDDLRDQLARLRADIEDPEILLTLGRLQELVQHCRRQGKALVENQSCAYPDQDSLLEALRVLAVDVESLFHFIVRIEGESFPDLSSDQARGTLFLILQEMIRNAYRHSAGSRVDLTLTPTRIRVLDDGKGLSSSQVPTLGQGCRNIRERALEIGLKAEIVCEPGNGWDLCPLEILDAANGNLSFPTMMAREHIE